MENIERTQFVVLTGHLDDRPLPDLFRTLRVQRKSGRLQVEYKEAPGAFFFEEGQLVDAQLGSLRGLEAVHAALSMSGGSFNFNPLVRPPERSLDRQDQKFISDLVETPGRENVSEIRTTGGPYAAPPAIPPSPQPAPLQLAPMPAELLAPLEERLTAVEEAIVSSSRRLSRERLIYGVVISFLTGLAVVMALQAIFNPPQAVPIVPPTSGAAPLAHLPANSLVSPAPAVASSQQAAAVPFKREPDASSSNAVRARAAAASATKAAAMTKRTEPASGTQTQQQQEQAPRSEEEQAAKREAPAETRGHIVNVLVEVRDGRVTSARVLDPRPSNAAYESIAVGRAKQRRYPENFTGAERVRIFVKP